MFRKIKSAVFCSLLVMISSSAAAHGGHDHSDPIAGLIHLAWAAPLLIIGAYVSYRLRKAKLAKQHEDKKQ